MLKFIIFISRLFPGWSKRFYTYLEKASAYLRGKGFGTGSLEFEITQCFHFLNTGPGLLVDVGGNKGLYSKILCAKAPGAQIHIFEPSDTNLQHLSKLFGANKHVTIVPSGLSDQAGEVELYADEAGSGMASLTKRDLSHFDIDFEYKETIRVIRFEDYWYDMLKGQPVDLMKIDVEGHELKVLKGCGTAISNIHVIQFEFGGCNIDTRTFFKDFYDFFKVHDFIIHRISPLGIERIDKYQESDEYFSTTNYIAVNRKLLK